MAIKDESHPGSKRLSTRFSKGASKKPPGMTNDKWEEINFEGTLSD